MTSPEAPATGGPLQRDVQPSPRYATLTCPNCLGTLQIQADLSAEAPCPICRHPLKYTPPETGTPKSFVATQRIERQAEPAPAVPPHPVQSTPPADVPPPARARRSLRTILREADEFLNTPAGTSLAWIILAALVTACLILFFHWDQDRRERTLRMETIESTRPAATHRPSTSTVPLLPGEPAPAEGPQGQD